MLGVGRRAYVGRTRGENEVVRTFASTPLARRALSLTVAAGAAATIAFGLTSTQRAHELAVLVGVGLLASTPPLWRGQLRLGRPRPATIAVTIGAWVVVCATLEGMSLLSAGPSGQAARHLTHAASDVTLTVEALIAAAALVATFLLRWLVRPAAATNQHHEGEHRAAREIIRRYGTDSLSPFVLRPDKALAFAAGGVLSYRVRGRTAIVSSDPVAPPGGAGEVMGSFIERAHARGWRVVVWAASAHHLDAYRRLGLRAVCVGEEAFVDPRRFTLDGRPVRKLRQSVNRAARRGWRVTVHQGREIDAALEAELDELRAAWAVDHPQLHGFAMSMGPYSPEVGPDDLYVLGRGPDGHLGAAMRFIAYGNDSLSLDTMHRAGETPNGLNEALVAALLTEARRRGVAEVSLNYAGLAHMLREETAGRRRAALRRLAIGPLRRRFQMDRLVQFNDKFSPEWRPRYLLCESRGALPRAIFAVLAVEGYLPERRRRSVRAADGGTRSLAGRPQPGSVG